MDGADIMKLYCYLTVALDLLLAANTIAAEPVDAVQPGAVWRDEPGRRTLMILDRQGETFRGRFQLGENIVREMTGTAKGSRIFWLSKDVKAVKGKPGGDNYGSIRGDKIMFEWHDADGQSGEYELIRVEGISSPAVAVTITPQPSSSPSMPLAPSLPPPPPIQTDPNQPRIEVIRDQGPNAVEWALAPLEEPIPPNIRQNLTYLREDLLDEAKAGPKAPAEAYSLGSDYCDKILAALRLREQARVQAGYRAAQADADIKVTNSQLDARRNYQMSWPQYQREESQRAALREQETSRADLKKEKVKVEWAARADQMRVALDAGYRQFREAIR